MALKVAAVPLVLAAVASAQSSPSPTFLLDASKQKGTVVKDSVAGVEFGTMAVSSVGSIKYWDLESATLTRSGGAKLTEGQEYTHAFCESLAAHRLCSQLLSASLGCACVAGRLGLQWTPAREYRTLFHHSLSSPATPDHKGDHCQFTQDGMLGVRSNRAPAGPGGPEFNACNPSGACYNITADATWRFVVAVGKGVTATSPMGNTTFYVGGPAQPVNVGVAARTCCGMSYDRVGWPGPGPANQGPGKVASLAGWNVALTPTQIAAVYEETKPHFGYT